MMKRLVKSFQSADPDTGVAVKDIEIDSYFKQYDTAIIMDNSSSMGQESYVSMCRTSLSRWKEVSPCNRLGCFKTTEHRLDFLRLVPLYSICATQPTSTTQASTS